MRARIWGGVSIALALALGTAACGGSTGGSSSGGGKPGSAKITIEDNPDSPMTDTFNPFLATSTGNTVNATTLMYEPLLEFNILNPQQSPKPWLSTAYTWSNGGKTITFTTRSNVKWSNGTPFTAADVAYTFNLIKANTALNAHGLPIVSASAPNATTAVINFKTSQYANLYYIGGMTYIVPQSIWKSVGNPTTYGDPKPIGTGPYTLTTFTPQGFTLTANPNFWGGKPKIQTAYFPAYSTNVPANQALSNGEITWAGNDVTNIQKTYVAKDPAHNKYWFPAMNTVSLVMNLTKAPFNDVKVRQALSAAINRGQLSTVGETGYEAPATSSSGMIPSDAAIEPASTKNDLKPTPDLAKVSSLMQSDGYTKQGGYWTKNGKPVSFTVEDPTTFTDYYLDDTLLASQFKAAGFKVSVDGTSQNAWQNDMAVGNFDTVIYWGQAGPTPFFQYQSWMDDTATAPIGKTAFADYGRWQDSATQAAISAYESSEPGSPQATTALQQLGTIESTELPTIPLVYGAGWDEYNTKDFTGWPTADNPYNAPLPNSPMIEYTLLHLTPVS
jgi:peptide/nickel transport system substrate-binding protein